MFVTVCSPGSGCSGVNLCDDCSSGLRSSLRLYRVMRDVSTAAGRPRELNELIDQLRPQGVFTALMLPEAAPLFYYN